MVRSLFIMKARTSLIDNLYYKINKKIGVRKMDLKKTYFDTENCIVGALLELIEVQDFLIQTSTPLLGKILGKLAGIDTIPFILLTEKGVFKLSGIVDNHITNKKEYFTTSYYRVNSIEKGSTCVNLTLLRPINIENKNVDSFCEVVKLEKTPVCVEIDLSCICGLQILDPNLLKRKIIIEPKW